MGFSGRFKEEFAGGRYKIMFKIVPMSFDYVTVYRARVAVPG
jgi:hypothetical protein